MALEIRRVVRCGERDLGVIQIQVIESWRYRINRPLKIELLKKKKKNRKAKG